MAEISRFFGIVLSLFYDEHGPPHFHVRYAGHQASVTLDGKLLAGAMPSPQMRMVRAWLRKHREEIEEGWQTMRLGGKPGKIAPLRTRGEAKSSRDPAHERLVRGPKPYPAIRIVEWIEGNKVRLFFSTGEVKEMKLPSVRSARRARIVDGGLGLDPGDGFELSAPRLYGMRGRFVR